MLSRRKKFAGKAMRNSSDIAATSGYFTVNNAKQKAYRYLSLRAHSAREIEKKLKQKGFPDAVIKEALEKLFELKYLDDALFASQWARNLAVNKLSGNRKIIASLQEKGIAEDLIAEAIDAVRSEMPEEEAVALLIKKKVKALKMDDDCHFDRREKSMSRAERGILKIPHRVASRNDTEEVIHEKFDTAGRKNVPWQLKEKKRIFQSLMGRGFPAGLILQKIGKNAEDESDDDEG